MKQRLNDIQEIDFGLHEAHRLLKFLMADFSQTVGDPRLTSSHYRTLLYLREHGPECMKVICRHVGLEAGSFTPVADRLLDEKLVDRIRDADDRRRVLLVLTDLGTEKADEIRGLVRRHIGAKLSVLDDGLWDELVAAMITIRRINTILRGTMDET